MKELIKNSKISTYVSYFLYMCIAVGVVLHITPYFYNRSMWVDEAMLASSICTRSFKTLVLSPLDWGQSASVGWLYIVKILTSVFGGSENILRCWSLVMSFACMAMIYLILKNRVHKNYVLLFTAIFSLTDMYIYYGNEVKPYMSDNFCCLLTLYIWQKFREKKISLLKMAIAYSVLVWFSFSAVFFIAACMIIECLSIFKNITKGRNFRQIIRDLLKCAIVLISFVLYYVLWLSKTAGNAGGADYWNLLRFPLIPKSLSDIMLIIRMGRQFLAFYPTYIALFLGFLFFLYVVKVIISKKDESLILMPSIVSLLLLFVASYVGFYPVQARLVQVYCIVLLIFCGFMCQEIETSYVTEGKDFIKKCDKGRILYYSLLAGILGITGMYGCKNLFAKHVYKSGSEVSESIAYLEDKLKDTDAVYVYRSSIPVFTYETNYKVGFSDLKELPYQEDGIIWGQGLFSYDYKIPYSYEGHSNTTAVLEDANLIKDNQSVYLFTSHGERGVADLINELQKNGTVTMVVDSYNTHLYHYEKE